MNTYEDMMQILLIQAERQIEELFEEFKKDVAENMPGMSEQV